jgi:hypothetical protein
LIHEEFCRYYEGAHYERSIVEALRWWQRAADMGYERVMSRMVRLMQTMRGHNLESNLVYAYHTLVTS